MDRDYFEKHYWSYYLFLEKQLIACRDYVDFSVQNKECFSNAFASLILDAGGELDTVFKVLCNQLDESAKGGCISQYKSVILENWKEIEQCNVRVFQSEYRLCPFSNWTDQTLEWWDNYNELKHSRVERFCKGNLHNALNIFSAMFILEMKMFKEIAQENEKDIPDIQSSLFNIENWNTHSIPLNDLSFVVVRK